MKKILATILLAYIFISSNFSQNLDFINAEKFDFRNAKLINQAYFGAPLMLCDHTSDLGYFGVDFDPQGVQAASIFQLEGNQFMYSGTFQGDSKVGLLDMNYNENTDHLTILLDVEGPCVFNDAEGDNRNFDFPNSNNLSGIIHFSDSFGLDSFWTTSFVSDDFRYQGLWNAHDLTLISGALLDTLVYKNPDESEVVILGESNFNAVVFAIDKNGYYKWSYVTGGGQYTDIIASDDEIIVAHDKLFKSKLIYLDTDGNEKKATPVLSGIVIRKIDLDNFNNLVMCGLYSEDVQETNLDFNSGEFYLDVVEGNAIDGFLARYDSEGSVAWAQTVNGSRYDTGTHFDIKDDYIYFTGSFERDVVFDGLGENMVAYEGSNASNVYFAKFHTEGKMEWVQVFEENNGSNATSIFVEEDVISIVGLFREQFDANPTFENEEILTNENPIHNTSHFFLQLQENISATHTTLASLNSLIPNPASTIISTTNKDQKIIGLYSTSGIAIGHYNSSSIDISNLSNGMYIVNMENNGMITSQLISIIH